MGRGVLVLLLFSFHLTGFSQHQIPGRYRSCTVKLDLWSDSSLHYIVLNPNDDRSNYLYMGRWSMTNDSTIRMQVQEYDDHADQAFYMTLKIRSAFLLSDSASWRTYKIGRNWDTIPHKPYYANEFTRISGYTLEERKEWTMAYDPKWNGCSYYYTRLEQRRAHRITGLCSYHYTDGKLKGSGAIRDGKRRGKWLWYNEEGLPEKEEYYKRGAVIRTRQLLIPL